MKQRPNPDIHHAPSGGLSLPTAAGLVVLIGVGFLLGTQLPKSASDAAATSPPSERPAPRAAEATPPPVTLRSTDTIEDLLAAEPATLYARLALWLVDASADEMAAYWQAVKSLKTYPKSAIELLLSRWTLLDPQAAIAATKGGKWEFSAWSAWARHEPREALDQARERGKRHFLLVAGAIGESDPRLAEQLLEEHPDITGYDRYLWVDHILSGLNRTDPRAAMEFAALHPDGVDRSTISSWFREDPHATLVWLVDHGDDLKVFYDSVYMELHVKEIMQDVLRSKDPEFIRELASQCPQGKLRKQLEDMIFDRMLEKDSDAALAEAQANPSPLGASRQLVKVALREAGQNPGKSLEILDEVLRRYRSLSARTIDGANELVSQLAETQPEALLACVGKHAAEGDRRLLNDSLKACAFQDPDSLARWAQQQGPEIKAEAFEKAAEALGYSNQFPKAMEFAAQSSQDVVQRMLSLWRSEDPDGAARWEEANGR